MAFFSQMSFKPQSVKIIVVPQKMFSFLSCQKPDHFLTKTLPVNYRADKNGHWESEKKLFFSALVNFFHLSTSNNRYSLEKLVRLLHLIIYVYDQAYYALMSIYLATI